MAKYKTGNPALSERTFQRFSPLNSTGEAMTLTGTSTKTMLLLALCIGGAATSWALGVSLGACLVAALVAFVGALVLIFRPHLAPVLGPCYAIVEGVALGGVSRIYEAQHPGIVMNAFVLTLGVLGTMLILYRARIIQATENFKLGVISATGAVVLVYLFDIGASAFFGVHIPFVHDTGWKGILFSLAVVVIAALNLVLDFDFIENGVERKAPKYMEWYGAFGLLVTLVWLYLELLRLLGKGGSRK